MATKKKNSSPKATKVKGDSKKAEVKKEPRAPKKLEVKLVSYTVEATIPTMMYGNITPRITVEARTMEEAKLAVFPHIEDLYQTYCEEPRDGRKPAFMQKASVTSTERIVPQEPVAPKAEAPKASAPATPAPEKSKTPAQESADALAADLAKSPAFSKAEGAIKGAMSRDALGLIEDQIQKSTKLTAEEKPTLLAEVLKRRKDLN